MGVRPGLCPWTHASNMGCCFKGDPSCTGTGAHYIAIWLFHNVMKAPTFCVSHAVSLLPRCLTCS